MISFRYFIPSYRNFFIQLLQRTIAWSKNRMNCNNVIIPLNARASEITKSFKPIVEGVQQMRTRTGGRDT
jgi:hypothetical protein